MIIPSPCLSPKPANRLPSFLKGCCLFELSYRGPEREHLTSSGRDIHEVFDTPIGRVGMLVCWDLAFPEAFRELISQGAKIIIIPSFCQSTPHEDITFD